MSTEQSGTRGNGAERLKEIKHRFAGTDIRFSMSRMDFEWLIAEIERLRGLQDKWGEEFARADRHRFVAEQRAENCEHNFAIEHDLREKAEADLHSVMDSLDKTAEQKEALKAENQRLTERIERCRDYVMRIEENEITAADILDVLGYSRDGMIDLEAEQALQHKEGE